MIVNGEGAFELIKTFKQEEDDNSWETISEAETIRPPSELDLDEDRKLDVENYDFEFVDEIIAEEKLKGTYPDTDSESELDDSSHLNFSSGREIQRARPKSPDSEGFPASPEWSDNENEHAVVCDGSIWDIYPEEVWPDSPKPKRKRKNVESESAGTSEKKTRKSMRSRERKRKLSSAFQL